MFKSPNGSALRALTTSRSTIVAFAAIWAAGMVALAVIVAFQTRVDTQRRSQVVVERLQRQAGDLVSVAFDPATSAKGVGTTRAETAFRLAGSKAVIDASVNSIANLGDRAEADRLNELDRKYYAKINLLSALVAKGAGADAALLFGRDSRPDGSYGALLAELHRAGHAYGSEAEQSRRLAAVATAAALALLLAACSIALYRAARLTREKHRLLESSRIEAVTDALTGLPNRRKLFADVEAMLREAEPDEEFALGMFDLDGFKAYNDTFGHPAGDALLRRCAQKLAASVKGTGSAYRMGGDEFCVIAHGPDTERVLAEAEEALSEHGEHFDVRCSRGSVVMTSNETTLEEALQRADQRLYNDKRSKKPAGGEAFDVLVRVLAGHDATLATHATNVAALAEAVARELELTEEEITLTRLTAELHDVGKTAIPDSILNKPGPLNPEEWELIKRHTIIGERILAAAPGLARTAPLVRATHERIDGAGYPDGLRGNDIPLVARIVCVVDAYDAMTSTRSYAKGLSPRAALAELRRCAGSQFDSSIVEIFEGIMQRELAQAPKPVVPRLKLASALA